MKKYTIQDAVRIAQQKGVITINPLRYRKNPISASCFAAARMGLLRKVRENCGRYHFYPLPKEQ